MSPPRDGFGARDGTGDPLRSAQHGTGRPGGMLGSMPHFRFDGHRLAYTISGAGPRSTALLPGVLLSQKTQTGLARSLAHEGNRVITCDPLGHGASDRPPEM